MLLKAGTYRFNDELNLPDFDDDLGGQFDFTVNDIQYEYMGSFGGSIVRTVFGYATLDYSQIANVYFSDEGWQGDYQSHTILKDADVDETFGTWYIANTNYNEVNAEDTIYTEKSSWYKSVADAIRNKKGTTAPILRDDFASEISSITGGGETPYYDGTVIIEKAESVLGLRRIITNNLSSNLGTFVFDFTTEMNVDEETADYIGIEAGLVTITCDALTVEHYSEERGNAISYNCVSSSPDLSSVISFPYSQYAWNEAEGFYNGEEMSYINVIKCEDERTKAWLLANTEGVSV